MIFKRRVGKIISCDVLFLQRRRRRWFNRKQTFSHTWLAPGGSCGQRTNIDRTEAENMTRFVQQTHFRPEGYKNTHTPAHTHTLTHNTHERNVYMATRTWPRIHTSPITHAHRKISVVSKRDDLRLAKNTLQRYCALYAKRDDT